MVERLRRSLSAKILLVTGLAMGTLVGVASLWSGNQQRAAVTRLEHQTNQRFTQFVYNTLLFSMLEGKMEELQQILENVVGTDGVQALRVVAPDGSIRYSGVPEEVGRPLADPRVAEGVRRGAASDALIEMWRDHTLVNVLPLHNEGRCVTCHPADVPYLGAVLVEFDLSEFEGRIASIQARQWVVLAVSVLLLVGVVYVSLRLLVLRPLFRVVDAAQQMARGDLSQPVESLGTDEMGQLAEHLNTLRAHLLQGVEQSGQVATALADAVEELDRSSEDLVAIAMEQSSGAAEQASAVQEATTTAEEIAATSNEISANVASVEEVSEETYHASVKGRESVRSAVAGMQTVRAQVQEIADSMLELGKKSQKVGGIVDIIDEISEQTHLLALNAAIEAAGAGEHGKRFGVVAAEIRRLAERTVEATTQIKALIEEIQDSTNETLLTTERGTASVLAGADRVDQVGESLEGILVLVRQTKESAKEITVATQQQATAGEQLVLTITDINDVAVQVNRSAEQVEKAVAGLQSLARRLKELVRRNLSVCEFHV